MKRKLSHQEIVARQQDQQKMPMPVVVVLNNVRSLYNVGSIFRTADGAGIEKIWLCGITGSPPNNQISKTALGAQDHVPWAYHQDVLVVVTELKANGYSIVLLEQTSESVTYEQYCPTFPVCLVVGNEVEGVHDQLVSLSDQSVEIDMAGMKNSLNVSVAFGIIAYHLRQQYKVSTSRRSL